MADFRQLALTYVLTDDKAELLNIAKEAATAIREAPRASNAVGKWVQSIGPWIQSDDDQMEDGEDGETSGDVIARSKALSFLAATLEELPTDVLKTDQINLLITFFGALFNVDQKAGILPATQALARVTRSEAFQAEKAHDILQSVCNLGDDFKNQKPETRLPIYELCERLISDEKVASDLQYRHGQISGFMTQLIQLCRNERDPKCLLKWFSMLRKFLADFSTTPEVDEEIFSTFSAYFPISMRSPDSKAGITSELLKETLRGCFAAHYRLARLVIPYLLGKLDQGDGVSVNIKLDILKTLKACVDGFDHPQQSITPFADKIWSSLKYEVRNGENNDTIRATLDVIRSLSNRLTATDLRDFCLMVQRDALEDLANPTYTAAVGKLLISVHSANLGAFAIMISPTITHIKDNLRHPKSPGHTNDLLGLLNSLLGVRLILLQPLERLATEDERDHTPAEPLLTSLYTEAYLAPFKQATKDDVNSDDTSAGVLAIKGMGLLVCQPPIQSLKGFDSLLPSSTCSEICSNLSNIMFKMSDALELEQDPRTVLGKEAVNSLQKIIAANPSEFEKIVIDAFEPLKEALPSDRPSRKRITGIMFYHSQNLARIGCLELPKQGDKFVNFVLLLGTMLKHLKVKLDEQRDPELWTMFAGMFLRMFGFFWTACQESLPKTQNDDYVDARFHPEAWNHYVATTFPTLPQIHGGDQSVTLESQQATAMDLEQKDLTPEQESEEIRTRFTLICLFVTRQLYRRATKVVSRDGHDAELSMELSADFANRGHSEIEDQNAYLCLVGRLATFTISKMSWRQQQSLILHEEVVTLFRGNDTLPSPGLSGNHRPVNGQVRDVVLRPYSLKESYEVLSLPTTPVGGFIVGRQCLLSLGVVQALHPAALNPFFSGGMAHQILLAGLLSPNALAPPELEMALPFINSILTILGNKSSADDLSTILVMMEHQLEFVLIESEAQDIQTGLLQDGVDEPSRTTKTHNRLRSELAIPVLAITAGVLRWYRGTQLTNLFEKIRQCPKDKDIGHTLARNIGGLFARNPDLDPEFHPQIKFLWSQRAYVQMIKPMLAYAWPHPADNPGQMLVLANYSLAIIYAVKHLPYQVYEDDAEDLIRLSVCAMRYLPIGGEDVWAVLQILVQIAVKAPLELFQPFLKSVVDTCMIFLGKEHGSKEVDMSWMPQGYVLTPNGSLAAMCRGLTINLLGNIGSRFQPKDLLPLAPRVNRMLAETSGDPYREVRKAALMARAAWTSVK